MAYESFEDAQVTARGMQNQPAAHDVVLDNRLDELQKGIVDRGLISQLIAITVNITTGTATTALYTSNAPFAFEIIDVIIQARATEGSGAVTITNGSSSITDAITCDTDNEINKAGTIDVTYSKIALGGSLVVGMGGGTAANMKALVTFLVIPT